MGQHSGIGVVDKTVAILAAAADGPAALSDLVERTQIPRATAHRLAVALEVHRLLIRDSEGRFIPGPRLAELAATAGDPLLDRAIDVLAWVRDTSGESAQLYRRDGRDRVCVAAAERAAGLRTTVPLGARLPLTAGSGAQVLCAWEPPDTVSHLLQTAQFTDRSLAEVRRRGWAQSVGQREAGVASVSAPVFGRGRQVVAAISISGPIERLGRSPGQRLAPILTAGAQRLQAALT
ncbi:IclR family transcriptional regulator [Jatrophihabitans lederbergiae]|jgi:DNA-binding IclR family transcriptional regulator|uniref:IclR family transcriptional regulator n=1 Tax=Jatrophihabitans lederbergiae TaxID=3075547 RepID=A0ABU2J4H4_9ACTN|nr:IclR family transcriptional regulator [Jatrophihabitans sp. DSM 44399]MDT0259885.1 IclR family transcriptional regulator [Jatrophihabitans sp. DSM 44399]